jgi:hypothetical protein
MDGRTISWRGIVGRAFALAVVLGASCKVLTAEGGPELCPHAVAPSPPEQKNLGGVETFVVAWRKLLLQGNPDPGAAPIGLDLDKLCTCQGEPSSCVAPAGQPDGGACDGEDGRDLASSGLLGILGKALNKDDLGVFYSGFAEKGVWGVLLRVSGYNGEANDDEVRLEWYVSAGFGALPLWDGSDAWPISSKSLMDGSMNLNEPRYVDPLAYVKDGMLVASLPEGAVVFAGGMTNLELRLTAGTLMGRIEKGANGYSIVDGNIATRMRLADAFLMVSSFRSDEGLAFCTNDIVWTQLIRPQICRAPDIQVGAIEPNKPCDAISFGIGFDAYPAQLGNVVPVLPPAGGCPPEFDPINDSCDKP